MNSLAIVALAATALVTLDQAVKIVVHRVAGLQVTEGRLWISRTGAREPNMLWLWVISAATLVVVAAWIPTTAAFVGLMVGGSLSNAVDGALRGSITDFFRLPFWPSFNMADIALTVGAIGIVVESLRAIGEFTG